MMELGSPDRTRVHNQVKGCVSTIAIFAPLFSSYITESKSQKSGQVAE